MHPLGSADFAWAWLDVAVLIEALLNAAFLKRGLRVCGITPRKKPIKSYLEPALVRSAALVRSVALRLSAAFRATASSEVILRIKGSSSESLSIDCK